MRAPASGGTTEPASLNDAGLSLFGDLPLSVYGNGVIFFSGVLFFVFAAAEPDVEVLIDVLGIRYL